ncbi:RHS repeat-associated core [Photorhabdus khanii NC19]|uniref:RHS repeat-associated core n=1 Tax=Photorhabdus khanii NC19 TaxID=1004151 RepID=W3V3X7_9GAMM|nr:RHS repeat-associated core domain-containing protein [Photorhabdus khanii]ETS29764.1 RHS repeat-associated core [Photorhabdus khanii NC19]
MENFDPKFYQHTPTVNVLDNRGLTIRDIGFRHSTANGTTDTLITRHQYDARGHLIQSIDPRLYEAKQKDDTIKPNFLWQYDLTGNILCTESVDAGRTVTLNDIESRPILTVTATGARQTRQYETSPLPGRLLSVTEQAPEEKTPRITEYLIWAENTPTVKAHNLAGQCVRHYDTAGVTRPESLSLTGTVLSQSQQLLDDKNGKGEANWAGNNETTWQNILTNEIYTTQNTCDSTGTLLTQTDAKGNMQRLAYDVAGQLKTSWLTVKGQNEQIIVKSLTYSAAGQKLREEHGNNVITEYIYEPQTQRLIGITTQHTNNGKPGAKKLQDLRYKYDPVGNIISIRNDAEATRFWKNEEVKPENTYIYDSLYQLISATGREMANIRQQSISSPVIPLTSDNNTYTKFTRNYTYDDGGNLTKIQHRTSATQNNHTRGITVSNCSNRAVLSTLTDNPKEVDSWFDAGGHQKTLHRAVRNKLTDEPAEMDSWFDTDSHQKTLNPSVLNSLVDDPAQVDTLIWMREQNLNWNTRGELQQVTLVTRSKKPPEKPQGKSQQETWNNSTNNDQEWYRYGSDGMRRLKISEQKTGNSTQQQRVTYLPGLELRTTGSTSKTTEDLQVIIVGEAGRAQVRVLHWESGKPKDISNNQMRYSYDNLIGSSQLELDNEGQIISQEEYYPFGGTALWAARNQTEASYKTIRYSGKERDATGLYYYGYRYYQPWVGRWLSADPAGTVDGLNVYRMVRNNPVTLLDPDGRAPMASDDIEALKRNYNQESGDLFYGLAPNRGRYIKSVNPDFNSESPDSTPMIIDVYNNNISNTILSKYSVKKLGKLFNDPKKYSKDIKVADNLRKDIFLSKRGHYPLWDDYFNAGGENPKFNIANIYKDTISKYGSDYYHTWHTPTGAAPKLLWKRGSKLGLEIAANSEKTKIHFVLDGLDIEQVVNKTKGSDHLKAGPGESVTASELRYAYRNRERLKGKIHFYENDKETSAPWDKNPTLWQNYIPNNRSGNRNGGIRSRLSAFIRNIPTLFRQRR